MSKLEVLSPAVDVALQVLLPHLQPFVPGTANANLHRLQPRRDR